MGEGFRLRTMCFRGQISQGLLLPISQFSGIPSDVSIGDDVTELLGVRKWEIEERATTGGTVIGDLPYDIPHRRKRLHQGYHCRDADKHR